MKTLKTGLYIYLFMRHADIHGSYQNYNKILQLVVPQSLMMHERFMILF